MKRKIIRQGHNTLTITLPSKWTKKFDIQAGDYAELTEQGRCLKIETDSHREQKEQIVIDITGITESNVIWRLVSSAYRAGHDEIRIKFDSTNGFNNLYSAFTYDTIKSLQQEQTLSPIEAIQALVNRFIGFEIIEQRSDYCIIKDLGQTNTKEFDNTVRRIFRLLINMSAALVNAIGGSKDEIKSFHIIDTNLDRFEDYCLRVLNKNGYTDFTKTPTMYTLVFLLELVGDEFKRLGVHLFSMDKLGKNVGRFVKQVDKMINEYYDLYYNYTKEKATEMYKMEKEGYALFDEIDKLLTKDELELTHHLKKIGKYIMSLTELRIDLAY